MGKRWKVRRRRLLRRPPVALIVAMIALFVALGGGATAAQQAGLFTGKDIKNKSIGHRRSLPPPNERARPQHVGYPWPHDQLLRWLRRTVRPLLRGS